MQRAVKYAISDSEADALVKEAKEEYDKKLAEYSGSMERLRNELADFSKRKRSLMEIRDEKKLMLKMDEIMADQNRVKEYIHEYVTQIVLYKPDSSWVLVVVNFLDGSERWGTIKSDRYKKSELKNDDLFAEKKYGCWLVNNDSHRFVFDRETRIFSEIRSGRVLGKYTFEEFDQLTKERGMVGEFSPYEFNIEKE